jgi:hypothetical protein
MAVIATCDFEDQTVGNGPSNPPIYSSGEGDVTYTIRSSPAPPDGTKCLEAHVANGVIGCSTEWKPGTISSASPYYFTNGQEYFFAWYQRMDRVGGTAIWHTGAGVQSGDKGVEVYGVAHGVRWLVSSGHWSSFGAMTAGKWTIWCGQPTYHLNQHGHANHLAVCPDYETPGEDTFPPNQNGYSYSNIMELDCERWYSFVFAIKFETWDGGTRDVNGRIRVWVNGTLLYDYDNL